MKHIQKYTHTKYKVHNICTYKIKPYVGISIFKLKFKNILCLFFPVIIPYQSGFQLSRKIRKIQTALR